MIVFRIRSQHLFRILLVGIEIVAVTEFKEFQIRILAVGIMRNAFQSAEQQSLAHTVQVRTQRIQQHHQAVGRISFQSVIISGASQRVIQYFIESATHELLCN